MAAAALVATTGVSAATCRLFRISSCANSQYHSGILDALNRNYGPPKVLTGTFRTKGGAVFPNSTAIWSNGSSRRYR